MIKHVIPQVGFQSINFFPPTGDLYKFLREKKEIRRLSSLRHLGALARALPGIRQSRWDYTVALLYYSTHIKFAGAKNKFSIGKAEFSSTVAALQCCALVWNIGHLPGTYAVEKGVFRYLHNLGGKNIAASLDWPMASSDDIKGIITRANRLFQREEYFALPRVLAVIKLLDFVGDTSHPLFPFVVDFAAPFLLLYDPHNQLQWRKIRTAWSVVRHLSYLTLDGPLSGVHWGPVVPALFRDVASSDDVDLQDIHARISEMLSPLERVIYNSIYHCEDARKETAIVSDLVENGLSINPDPKGTLHSWMELSHVGEMKLGKRPSHNRVHIAASASIRSHFLRSAKSITVLENELKRKKAPLSILQKYKAWNSDAVIEPDEFIVDLVLKEQPRVENVGTLLHWLIDRFDYANDDLNNPLVVFRKTEIESVYRTLLDRITSLACNGCRLRFQAWPLREFGIFQDVEELDGKGQIWSSGAELDNKILGHVIRKRPISVSRHLKDKHEELVGIAKLRRTLKKKGKASGRKRWLVVTASLTVRNKDRDLIEFDGCFIAISSRTGKVTFYGIESKRGKENPLRSLGKRLKVLGVQQDPIGIDKTHAYVEISLG